MKYFDPKTGSQNYYLEPAGQAALALCGSGRMAKGTTYFTDGRAFHRVFPGPNENVATLLLQTPHQFPEYEVFAESEIKNASNIETRPLTLDELKHALTLVLEAL